MPLENVNPNTCPVVIQARQVLIHSTSLRAAVNKLRRDLRQCNDCPYMGSCQPLLELNLEIDSAIDALVVEWGLA